ncbi:GtrA family protein [Candidatus Saccharibacteria bacterium]|nr:GtrA family protein [Candidatus Saccharibacteria bacterium]
MNIHKQLTTFAAIGALNTAVDVTIYTLLIWLTVPLLLAIIISTTAGMICNYVLNRRFTFKTNHRPIVQFIYITITGLWVLQPVVIWLLIQLFEITSTLGLSMAKLATTSISLIWNFVWCRIVFQGTKKKHLRRSVFSWLRGRGSNPRPIG